MSPLLALIVGGVALLFLGLFVLITVMEKPAAEPPREKPKDAAPPPSA